MDNFESKNKLKRQITEMEYNSHTDRFVNPGDDFAQMYRTKDNQVLFFGDYCDELDKDPGGKGLLDKYVENTQKYFDKFSLVKACCLLKVKIDTLRHYGVSDMILLNKKIQDIVKVSYDGYLHLAIAGIVNFPELIKELTSAKVLTDEMKINLKDTIKDDQDFVIKKFVDYVCDISHDTELTIEQVTNLRSYYAECYETLGIEKAFIADLFQNIRVNYEGRNIAFIDLCEKDTEIPH